ncbi:hypothetical protein JCM17844_24660 [Iodidimonas gelatinilytica]|uniref:Response regulatory domain-containing protein n=1 Tax=Iodidimonas gelatinilytica TaxID=1236966 RepID=A0A5A7MVB1_9PROT|nr:response regulator [Iodidimonas gelatinilytica]GEQ98829.1 hypothetical protein JCM17844_24660 [Iodidimonas gelatinilytica]
MIVSDVEMPDMSGHAMVTRLLESGLRPCPILFLSANDTAQDMLRGLECGGDDFLLKGSDLAHLMDRLAFWLICGFRGLPRTARLNAISALESMSPIEPVLGQIKNDPALIDHVFERLHREIQSMPHDYGTRLIHRIQIMGRVAHLLEESSESPSQWVRFPDALHHIIRKLRAPWAADIGILCRYYDVLCQDPRFIHAGETGLGTISVTQES